MVQDEKWRKTHDVGPVREVPAPPSARGVRLASGRLTRSAGRNGGTEKERGWPTRVHPRTRYAA